MGRNATGKVKTLSELAKRLGVSRDTAQRWRVDGLEPDADGYYSIEEAKGFHHHRQLRAGIRGKVPGKPGNAETPLDVAIDAKQRKLKADADRAEFELAKAKGEYIARNLVQREWKTRCVQVRGRMIGLGREIAPRLVGRGAREIQAMIDQRVFEILRLLAHKEYGGEK